MADPRRIDPRIVQALAGSTAPMGQIDPAMYPQMTAAMQAQAPPQIGQEQAPQAPMGGGVLDTLPPAAPAPQGGGFGRYLENSMDALGRIPGDLQQMFSTPGGAVDATLNGMEALGSAGGPATIPLSATARALGSSGARGAVSDSIKRVAKALVPNLRLENKADDLFLKAKGINDEIVKQGGTPVFDYFKESRRYGGPYTKTPSHALDHANTVVRRSARGYDDTLGANAHWTYQKRGSDGKFGSFEDEFSEAFKRVRDRRAGASKK